MSLMSDISEEELLINVESQLPPLMNLRFLSFDVQLADCRFIEAKRLMFTSIDNHTQTVVFKSTHQRNE